MPTLRPASTRRSARPGSTRGLPGVSQQYSPPRIVTAASGACSPTSESPAGWAYHVRQTALPRSGLEPRAPRTARCPAHCAGGALASPPLRIFVVALSRRCIDKASDRWLTLAFCRRPLLRHVHLPDVPCPSSPVQLDRGVCIRGGRGHGFLHRGFRVQVSPQPLRMNVRG